jgi:hypothetical protein
MRKVFLLLLTAVMTPPTFVNAQQNPCDSILSRGIFNTRRTQSRGKEGSTFLSWFCSNQFSSKKNFQDAGGGAEIPIKGVLVSLNGHSINDSWEGYRNEACSISQGSFIHETEFEDYSEVVSDVVVKAWKGCTQAQAGFAEWVDILTPTVFTVNISYKSGLETNVFTLEDIQVTKGDLSCKTALAGYKGRVVHNSISELCERRDASKGFVILPRVRGIQHPPEGTLYSRHHT